MLNTKSLKLTIRQPKPAQTPDDNRVYHALDTIADAFNPPMLEEAPVIYRTYLDKGKAYAALCIKALDQAIERGWSATTRDGIAFVKGKPAGFRPKESERAKYLPVLACELLQAETVRRGVTLEEMTLPVDPRSESVIFEREVTNA